MSDQTPRPFGFDWGPFKEMLGGMLPPAQSDNPQDLSWVESYVQQTLRSAFHKPEVRTKSAASPSLQSEVFETHNYILVKIKLPGSTHIDNVRVMVSSTQLKLTIIGVDEPHLISLPKAVLSKSGKASYKDDVLQIRLRKQSGRKSFVEIPIRFI